MVLQLKVMGIEDPSTFDYVTAPSRAALLKALGTLAMLGALDRSGRVTPDGKKMAALPLDPAFAHLLVRYIHDTTLFRLPTKGRVGFKLYGMYNAYEYRSTGLSVFCVWLDLRISLIHIEQGAGAFGPSARQVLYAALPSHQRVSFKLYHSYDTHFACEDGPSLRH